VKITRTDIHNVLGKPGALTHFGFGKAEGSNRLHEALEKALKSPLLGLSGKGSALKESPMILLLLRGPKDISFAEMQAAVGKIEQIAGESSQIKVGVHADAPLGTALELHILASSGGNVGKPSKASENIETIEPIGIKPTRRSETQIEEKISSGNERDGKGADELFPVPAKPASKSGKKPAAAFKQMQGTLALDTYQRGRFDKSEPTIVEGEDLDVPTFLRKGIKLNPPSRK
jgi:cell division protein FtsZ